MAKVAAFDGEELLDVAYGPNTTLEHLSAFYRKYPFDRAIVATVVDLNDEAKRQLELLPVPLLRLNETTALPVENLYETPVRWATTAWRLWWGPTPASRGTLR